MGRSIKKGPYIDQKLFRRIHQQVEAGEKRTVKTYARSSATQSRFITAVSSCRFT
jgi:small subunit ribosomal protein S19